MKKWIRTFLGLNGLQKKVDELQKKVDDAELFYSEDYKAIAKRVSDLEEEVFDCSDDEK